MIASYSSNGSISLARVEGITKRLTCGEIATCVRHRFLAIVDGVRLYLIGGAWCQLLDTVLKCCIIHQKGTIKGASGFGESQHLNLKRSVIALCGWRPGNQGILAAAYLHRQIRWWIRRYLINKKKNNNQYFLSLKEWRMVTNLSLWKPSTLSSHDEWHWYSRAKSCTWCPEVL